MSINGFENHHKPLFRRRSALAALLTFLLIAPAAPVRAERLRILHTNDIHSHLVPFVTLEGDTVGGAAHLATLLKEQEAAEPNNLYLDAGDLFQGTPFYNFFRGEAEMRVMSALGCDAMALGNHELDNGPMNFLKQACAYATFPIVCANVVLPGDTCAVPNTNRPRIRWYSHAVSPWISRNATRSERYRPTPRADRQDTNPLEGDIQKAGKIAVAVIGVTTESLPQIVIGKNIRDVKIQPVIETVAALMPEVRARRLGQPDLVVVLSHCGLAADSVLAATVPGIDVIVSGHDHRTLKQPIFVANPANRNGIGGTLIVETGSFGRNLGCLDLDVQPGGRIAGWHDTLLAVTPRIPEDSLVASIVAGYQAKVGEQVNEVVAATTVPLPADSVIFAETALGNLITDLIREAAGTDIAFQNGGGIRMPIAAGPIRLGDLFNLLPFDNSIVTLKLTGAQVDSLCRQSLAKRGTGGFGQFSGLSFDVVDGRPAGIRVDGKPLDPSGTYSLATNNFTAGGGDGWTLFRRGAGYTDTGMVLRDAVVEKLKARGTVAPKVEGRIRFAGG